MATLVVFQMGIYGDNTGSENNVASCVMKKLIIIETKEKKIMYILNCQCLKYLSA